MLKIILIVFPLLFLTGFVDSIAGGGGLISLPAYLLAGLPIHSAIATNKLSSAMGTTVSTVHFLRKGYMNLKTCIPGIIAALVGSSLGANLSLHLNERSLKILVLFVLPFAAFHVLRSKNLEKYHDHPLPPVTTVILCTLISFFVGAYDGLYGPGTGTFLLLLFTGVCHLSLENAAGTTKAINLTTNVVSLVIYIMNGKVLIPLGLAAGLFNMAGNYVGSHCFSSKGNTFVRPVILVVLTIFFAKTILELAGIA